jgi:hypothetical protein
MLRYEIRGNPVSLGARQTRSTEFVHSPSLGRVVYGSWRLKKNQNQASELCIPPDKHVKRIANTILSVCLSVFLPENNPTCTCLRAVRERRSLAK